jgi:hypothetical protein
MRIGDVGSVSLSGDLLAFSLAVSIVLMLGLKAAEISSFEEEKENGVPLNEVDLLLEWEGFDPDKDGLIEPYGPGSLEDNRKKMIPVKGNIGVSIEWNDTKIIHEFEEGFYIGTKENWGPDSQLHGFSVLIETRNGTFPGIMNFCYLEGSE